MMNVLVVLLAKRALFYVVESLNSKVFSLAPLACSKLPVFCIYNSIAFQLIAFTISCTCRGELQYLPKVPGTFSKNYEKP